MGPRHRESARRTSAESLVRAYRLESQRQKLMVRKAKLCEVKLLATSTAIKMLVGDEDYINLLRAEKLETMPKFLADRGKQPE
jgi:ParB family chromosome partitioning protein